MWLMTPIGFFSIVEKPEDQKAGTLTICSQVHADLERLREFYLPGMSEVVDNGGSDYRYGAKARRAEVSGAVAKIANDIQYANFKDEVVEKQGEARAAFYGRVWEVLSQLPDEPPKPPKDEFGELIRKAHETYLSILETITPRERAIWCLRFSKPYGKTLEAIGIKFQLTRQRISQILQKTFRKLRHPSRSEAIRTAIEELCAVANTKNMDLDELASRVHALDNGLYFFFRLFRD